jgi:hypothetical protein
MQNLTGYAFSHKTGYKHSQFVVSIPLLFLSSLLYGLIASTFNTSRWAEMAGSLMR